MRQCVCALLVDTREVSDSHVFTRFNVVFRPRTHRRSTPKRVSTRLRSVGRMTASDADGNRYLLDSINTLLLPATGRFLLTLANFRLSCMRAFRYFLSTAITPSFGRVHRVILRECRVVRMRRACNWRQAMSAGLNRVLPVLETVRCWLPLKRFPLAFGIALLSTSSFEKWCLCCQRLLWTRQTRTACCQHLKLYDALWSFTSGKL